MSGLVGRTKGKEKREEQNPLLQDVQKPWLRVESLRDRKTKAPHLLHRIWIGPSWHFHLVSNDMASKTVESGAYQKNKKK